MVLQTKIFMVKYHNDNIIYLNLAQISFLAMQKIIKVSQKKNSMGIRETV
jgi:hypothetical protein